jgi:hypothetical protein
MVRPSCGKIDDDGEDAAAEAEARAGAEAGAVVAMYFSIVRRVFLWLLLDEYAEASRRIGYDGQHVLEFVGR